MIFDTGQNGGKENVSMILIDYKDRRPLYEQIVEKLSDLMVREENPDVRVKSRTGADIHSKR